MVRYLLFFSLKLIRIPMSPHSWKISTGSVFSSVNNAGGEKQPITLLKNKLWVVGGGTGKSNHLVEIVPNWTIRHLGPICMNKTSPLLILGPSPDLTTEIYFCHTPLLAHPTKLSKYPCLLLN
jgi:hypothetical protein